MHLSVKVSDRQKWQQYVLNVVTIHLSRIVTIIINTADRVYHSDQTYRQVSKLVRYLKGCEN